MGASGREWLNFRMEVEHYKELNEQTRALIEIKNVEVEDFDYSHCETWQRLKKESLKAYKDLKNHEYNLRHNIH